MKYALIITVLTTTFLAQSMEKYLEKKEESIKKIVRMIQKPPKDFTLIKKPVSCEILLGIIKIENWSTTELRNELIKLLILHSEMVRENDMIERESREKYITALVQELCCRRALERIQKL